MNGGAVYVGAEGTTGILANSTFINNSAKGNGGAVDDWFASSGEMENSTFINNSARNGGAVYVGTNSDTGRIYNSTFINNTATNNGGAVDWNASSGFLENSSFISNSAGFGGAVFVGAEGSNGAIINSTFINNTALVNGGAVDWNSSRGALNYSYFENNSAENGGAVFVGGSSATGIIFNTTFINNTATQNGGAVDWNASSGFVEWSTFIENSADYGGALYCGGGAYEGSSFNNTFILNHADHNGGAVLWVSTGGNIIDSQFINNTAGIKGDEGIEGNGGALFIGTDGTTGKIINTTFFNNSATKNGGAIDWNASGGYVENSIFENNTAYDGGALYRGGSSDLGRGYNNTFITNVAEHDGGAVYWAQSRINITNYTFIDNIAGNNGGAIFAGTVGEGGTVINSTFKGNNATNGQGGAIDWDASQGTVVNSTFDQNAALEGGAIHIGSTSSRGIILSSNFTDNMALDHGGAIDWDGASGQVNGSLFEGNVAPKGAAMYIDVQAEEMNVTHSQFNSNVASEEGGAIYVNHVKNVSVTNASFHQNSAEHAGAIYVENAENFVVENSNFTQNTALDDGAIHWSGENGTIFNSTFTQNHADDSGGAIGWKGQLGMILNSTFNSNSAGKSGGAVLWYGDETDMIANSTFTSNIAYNGGAIYWTDGDGGIVSDSTFTSNVGYDKGGAISVFNNTNNVIENSSFNSNKAPGYFNEEGIQYGTGGAIYSEKVSGITIQNDTFVNNLAALNGGTIALDDTNSSLLNNITIDGSMAGADGGSIYWINSEEIVINATNIINSEAHDLGGSIYIKADGNIENTTIDGSTAKYDSAGAIYVDGNLVLNHTNISNFNSLNNVATAILFDGGESYMEDSILNGKNAVVVGEDAKAHLIRNTITDDSGEYSVLNNGDLWLDKNNFDDVIINDGIIETQTYTVILDNETYTVLQGETAILNATIEDDNHNIIVVTNDDFFAVTKNGSSSISYVPAYYSGRVNYGNYEDVQQGVYLVSANSADLKMNTVQTGVLRVQAKTNLALSVEKTSEGKIVVIAATPYPSDGIPYVGNVTFTINGIARDPIELNNGVAELTLEDVPSGTYQLSAFYTGDTYHTNASNETIFIINKIPVDIDISIANIVYGQNATAVANLSNNANGTVIFILNGRKEVAIDGDGRAIWENIAGLAPGNYTITAVYPGNEYFEMAYKEQIFEVSKANTTIVAVATPDTVEYRQEQLINIQLNSLATGTVKVTINGVEYFADVTAGGLAVVNVTGHPIGEYSSIEVLYSGDDCFNVNNTTVYFDVTPMNVTKIKNYDFNVSSTDINYGENEEIEVRLPADATGTVKVLVDGVEIANKTIGVDTLIFTVPKPYADEQHNITVIYSGDDIYEGKTNETESFKVSPVDPDMTVNVLNITYMQNETIEVVLPDDAQGTVTISLNGEQYGEPVTVSGGRATIVIPSDAVSYLEAGTYEVTATYSGDNNYNGKEAANTFIVSKIASDISVDAVNVDYGENETITLELGVANASGKVNVTFIDITTGNVVKSEIVDMTTGTKAITYADVFGAGSYRVNVEYYGDKNYLNSTSSATFAVNKIGAELTEESPNINYGANEVITVRVTSGATGTIYIIVNGTYYDPVVIYEDQAVFTIIKPNAGNYNFTAYYSGDDNYQSATLEGAFNVSKVDVELSSTQAPVIDYGENEIITVSGIPADATGTVKVLVDGVEIANQTVDNLVFTVIKPGAADQHDITIIYSGDGNYNGATITGEFKVNTVEPNMTVTVENIVYGDDLIVEVFVADDANGKVSIAIGQTEYGEAELVDGRATFTISGLNAQDDLVLSANFTSYGNYTDKSATQLFNVSKADSHVNVVAYDIKGGETETIDVILLDQNAHGKLEIRINNSAGVDISQIIDDFATTTEEGVHYSFENLPLGVYDVYVRYYDDPNYFESEAAYKFAVSFITVVPTNINYKENETISVIAPPDATGSVTITIDTGDANYTITKNLDEAVISDNMANLTFVLDYDSYPLDAGRYIVFANYTGDSNYDPVEVKNPFVVYKAASNVDIAVNSISYGNNELINVTVTGVDGELITDGFVTIRIGNDIEITNPIGNDGVARFNVAGLVVNDYSVNATFNGNDNYNTSSIVQNFSVIKANITDMSVGAENITYGNDENITVTIGDFNATGTVYLEIYDGEDLVKTTGKVTVSNGVAQFSISDLPISDNYKVIAYYGDDLNYNDMNVSDFFKVEKASPDVTVTPVNITYGNVETIKITIPNRNVTGNITITIAGITKSVNVTGGVGEINFTDLNVGNYSTVALYHDDVNYMDVEIPISFEVAKATPVSIEISPQNITYGQVENITVTVNGIEGFDIPTGNVTISIDIGDTIYTNTSNLVDGVARFSITGLNVSNYRVFATYNGDEKYNSIGDTLPFYVNKAPTTLDVQVANITYGEDELINVTVIGVEDGETPTLFITIIVNGTAVNMSKEVDGDGIARFNVTGLLAGEYEVNATYSGDNNYNVSSGIGRFNVTKTSDVSLNITAANITYGDDETITVTISDESAQGNLTITIGDYTDTREISGGQAVFTVADLEAGDYNVTASYSGDANHNPISIAEGPSKEFTVFKASSSTVVNPINIIYKQNETINVSVSGVFVNDIVGYNLTGNVTIYIDGVENQTKSISEAVSGILQFTVEGLSVGDHNVTARYHDDRNYNDSEDEKVFNVANALPEDMVVIPQNITYHIDNETITIDLGEVLNGTLQLFIIEDSVETLVQTINVEDQQIITSNAINNLAVGEYIAKAVFTANGDSTESSAPFHVSKAPTTVVAEAENSIYGEAQIITVTVDNTVADKYNLTGNVSIQWSKLWQQDCWC